MENKLLLEQSVTKWQAIVNEFVGGNVMEGFGWAKSTETSTGRNATDCPLCVVYLVYSVFKCNGCPLMNGDITCTDSGHVWEIYNSNPNKETAEGVLNLIQLKLKEY